MTPNHSLHPQVLIAFSCSSNYDQFFLLQPLFYNSIYACVCLAFQELSSLCILSAQQLRGRDPSRAPQRQSALGPETPPYLPSLASALLHPSPTLTLEPVPSAFAAMALQPLSVMPNSSGPVPMLSPSYGTSSQRQVRRRVINLVWLVLQPFHGLLSSSPEEPQLIEI